MSNISELKQSSNKGKFLERSKLITEFKGLNHIKTEKDNFIESNSNEVKKEKKINLFEKDQRKLKETLNIKEEAINEITPIKKKEKKVKKIKVVEEVNNVSNIKIELAENNNLIVDKSEESEDISRNKKRKSQEISLSEASNETKRKKEKKNRKSSIVDENIDHIKNNRNLKRSRDDDEQDLSINVENEEVKDADMCESKKKRKVFIEEDAKKPREHDDKSNDREMEDNNALKRISKISQSIHKKNTYILLENIDACVTKDDLESYLKENGVEFNKLSLIPGPLAVTFFNKEKDLDRLFNICQGLYFKNNELLIVKSSLKSSNNEFITTNMSNISVHIKNLDITTTEDDISALLDDKSKVRTITINAEKRTAIIDFLDSESASQCIKKLDNYKLGERVLQASFLVITQRPDQFILKVSSLPYGFNKLDIQESFPTASKIKIIKGQNRYCQLNFKTFEDFEAVLQSQEPVFVKGTQVVIEEITKNTTKKVEKKDNFILNVFNMPFDMTLKEIKDQYPKVRYVEMLKNPDGMFVGSAKLNFDEKEDCEEALKNTKGLTLKHRRIRAEMKVEHVGSKDEEQKNKDDE